MSKQSRSQRRRLLREAEGFLELAVLFDDRHPLEPEQKRVLADRCLTTLDQVDVRQSRKSRVLYLRGQAHRLAGRYVQAIEALETSWDLDQANIHTCLALGWCFKRTGHVGLAIEAMQKALSIDRSSGIVHYNMACYLALLQQTKLAVIHLSTAFEISTRFRDLVHNEPDFDGIRTDPEFKAIAALIA